MDTSTGIGRTDRICKTVSRPAFIICLHAATQEKNTEIDYLISDVLEHPKHPLNTAIVHRYVAAKKFPGKTRSAHYEFVKFQQRGSRRVLWRRPRRRCRDVAELINCSSKIKFSSDGQNPPFSETISGRYVHGLSVCAFPVFQPLTADQCSAELEAERHGRRFVFDIGDE